MIELNSDNQKMNRNIPDIHDPLNPLNENVFGKKSLKVNGLFSPCLLLIGTALMQLINMHNKSNLVRYSR